VKHPVETGSSKAPGDNHKATIPNENKPKFNKINELIKMTCSREITDKIVKINDVKSKSTPRPIINLKIGSGYSRGWLFDTGAAITCMAIKELKCTFWLPVIRIKVLNKHRFGSLQEKQSNETYTGFFRFLEVQS
jgi:hypothetical protein